GAGALTKQGAGTLTLSGANSYTGGTVVEAGTLNRSIAYGFVSNASYTIDWGTLDLNDFDLTMSSLSGTGGNLALGNGNLTDAQSANTAFSGGIVGSGRLTKSGSGTLTLRGANTQGGGTFIKAGVLKLDGGYISHASADVIIGDVSGDNGTLQIIGGAGV